MKTIRVFPRRTKATPTDDLAYVGLPTLFVEGDSVHISVAFTWDIPVAEELEREWKHVAPVIFGGPAFNDPGAEFVPGMYLKRGYVITSRGCPNKCWFCRAWRNEGKIRELPITEGYNVLDNNLLACSDEHIRNVFAMLARQQERPRFTGGLEAARLQDWHVQALSELKPKITYFAFDTEGDREPLVTAAQKLSAAGLLTSSHTVRCYVLCGWEADSISAADARCRFVASLRMLPMAMLLDNRDNHEWRRWRRTWANPYIAGAQMKRHEAHS